MKICKECGRHLSEDVNGCPDCGSDTGQGLREIDDYEILEVVHQGYASSVAKAVKKGQNKPVALRVFSRDSNMSEEIAYRLKLELDELHRLPEDRFVQHREFHRSSQGLWYRVSDWVDAEAWGDLLSSGELADRPAVFHLFSELATSLALLHSRDHILPHLTASDVLVVRGPGGRLKPIIDYKVSRFLNPDLDKPRPILARLLERHPDIVNNRPLDKTSDVWSLGKLMVEVLSSDFEEGHYQDRIDGLDLSEDATALLKAMLSDEPSFRPSRMSEVAERLARLAETEHERGRRDAATGRVVRKLSRRVTYLTAIIAFVVLGALVSWYQFGRELQDTRGVMEKYAEKYAKSVALVAVEYWLEVGDNKVYGSRSEGTAFLVDKAGYLLTNRHVACPWLEDPRLEYVVTQLRQSGNTPVFKYRTYLWFEGQRAFNRSAGLLENPDMTDIYFTEQAYSNQGKPSLSIAGVARAPSSIRQMFFSPLRADFAVLKIDPPPQGLETLPLARAGGPENIARLSEVMILGFPLGSQTPGDKVTVSVTQGRVRRTFEHLIQIDASFYGGNSGGPVIDASGRVIGLAAGVASGGSPNPLLPATPFWHMALVQPIGPAANLLSQLLAGQPKWDGVLDLTAPDKIKEITAAAEKGRWAEAMEKADRASAQSTSPNLALTAGMIHFCVADYDQAKTIFQRNLTVGEDEGLSRMMLFMIDWLAGKGQDSPHVAPLLSLDWRSGNEFFGYLTRVALGRVPIETALDGWENESERSALESLAGFSAYKKGDLKKSWRMFRQAAVSAGLDGWEYLVARAWLDRTGELLIHQLTKDKARLAFQKTEDEFGKKLAASRLEKAERDKKLAPLRRDLESNSQNLAEMAKLLAEMLKIRPDARDLLMPLAFIQAAQGNWDQALTACRRFLTNPNRPGHARLALGLLEPICLRIKGQKDEAAQKLALLIRDTSEPWYRSLAEVLDGRKSEADLQAEASGLPDKLLTLQTALGLWAEAQGNPDKAMAHYKLALESFMDSLAEYTLARERLSHLRKKKAAGTK